MTTGAGAPSVPEARGPDVWAALVDRSAEVPPAEPVDGIWSAVATSMDIGLRRPRLAPGVEVAHFTTRWGAGYTMAKTERGPTYLRFEGDEGFILDQLDGTRTVRQVVVDRLSAADDFDPAAVVDVVEILEQTGFLEQPWVDTDQLIRGATRSRVVRWNDRMRAALKSQTVRVRQVDVWADWLYRHGARYVFTRGGQVVLLVLLFGGLALFVDEVHSGRFRLSGQALVTSASLLLALDFLATMVHEAGHALAIRHARRRILSGGFQLYLGHPAFFIDSADILMSPPRDRIRQAWFGPYASLVVAGVSAALAWFFPHLPIAHVLFNLAVLTYFTALMNLIPFLELDGYWILMDALQTTDLRPRSLSFLRRELPRKLRLREPFTRFEQVLVGFGVLGAIFTVIALATSVLFWGAIFGGFTRAMWDAGLWAQVALVAIAVFVLGPLVHGIGEAAASLLGRIRFMIERARFRRELGWRRDAGVAIAGLPMLGDLSMDAVNELAGRVTLRRAARGEAVVRRNERADAFYVIRSGRVHVVDDLPSGDQPVLRSLGAGEGFGELALLQAGPRTATVVAAEDTELFVVDKGSFDRLLAGNLALPEVATTMSSIEEVWALPPFRHLAAADARQLAEAGRWQTYPPGADVVRQGEPGAVFYVIAGGRLVVTENGAEVRELVRGEHFGELALLNDVPRSATVTARTPVRLFELDRPAFEVVVASSLRAPGQRSAVHDHAVPVRT